MLPPSSSTTTTTTTTTAAAVSRSYDNLSAYLSAHLRPWPYFSASLSPPPSLSTALARLRTNSAHFLANYLLLLAASASLFLLVNDPFALLVYALLALAWTLGYFFRNDDPVVLYGRVIDPRTVLIGLGIGTVLVVWMVGMVKTVSIGVLVGALVCAGHGVFRDTDGLFLDEEDAVTNGLIASGSRPKGFSV